MNILLDDFLKNIIDEKYDISLMVYLYQSKDNFVSILNDKLKLIKQSINNRAKLSDLAVPEVFMIFDYDTALIINNGYNVRLYEPYYNKEFTLGLLDNKLIFLKYKK